MPDRRRHRGPHPGDAERFAAERLPTLRRAADDLAWLLEHDYAERAALALVGDRFGLDARQRQALRRAVCTAAQRRARQRTMLAAAALADRPVVVDGFNVLTTVEAALAGGAVLAARDGCYRDLASMHGTWRRVLETGGAARRIGEQLQSWRTTEVHWLLDRPVGNSGRLATRLRELAAERGLPWRVELVDSPDHLLRQSHDPIATADSAVLDAGRPWVNLARAVVEQLPQAWVLRFAALDEPAAE